MSKNALKDRIPLLKQHKFNFTFFQKTKSKLDNKFEQLNRKKSSQNREEQSEEREEQTHSEQQEEDRDKNVKDVETSKSEREERKNSFSDLSESDSFELKLSDSEPRYFCVGSWSERRNESAKNEKRERRNQQIIILNYFYQL